MGAVQRKLVEEGSMQGRPFRRYNDGSYKAASSNGWIKFDNLDSMVEYHRKRDVVRKPAKDKTSLLKTLMTRFK